MAKKQDSYKWHKNEEYYGEYRDALEWASPNLFCAKTETEKTPFLARRHDRDIAQHWFDLAIFPRQPYQRSYELEQISEEDRGDVVVTTSRKKFLEAYGGDVDALLCLSYSSSLDSEGRGHVAFLDGQVKSGRLPDEKGRYKEITNAEQLKLILDAYFKIKGFGANLANLINNSNLPAEVKKRCRGLA